MPVAEKESLKDLRGKIKERREKLATVFREAGEDRDMEKVKSLDGDSAEKVDAIRALNEEIDDLAQRIEPLAAEEATLNRAAREAEEYEAGLKGHPLAPSVEGVAGALRQPSQSLGELFLASGAGGELKGRDIELEGVDLHGTLFQTSAGWAPEVTRTGRLVDYATRPIQIVDVIPPGSTTQTAVKYMEETLFTNAAKEIGEGGEYPEAALKVEEKESPVKKIAVFLPVADEQLEDEPQARGYVDRRLPFMLRQRLDLQIATGDGEGDNLTGFLAKEGVQTQAKGADPVPDAIFKGMTKCEVTGQAMVGPVIIHPNNWQGVRLLRTNDGIYIWGNPSEAGPERIWGQRVVKAQAITEGTALTGDFANFSELATRAEVEVKVSDSHSDYFVKGKQAIRARIRVALVIYRPAAFCEITEI